MKTLRTRLTNLTTRLYFGDLCAPDTLAPGDAEEGSTTVEYAIGVVSAAAFAGLLLAIIKSGAVKSALEAIITSALSL